MNTRTHRTGALAPTSGPRRGVGRHAVSLLLSGALVAGPAAVVALPASAEPTADPTGVTEQAQSGAGAAGATHPTTDEAQQVGGSHAAGDQQSGSEVPLAPTAAPESTSDTPEPAPQAVVEDQAVTLTSPGGGVSIAVSTAGSGQLQYSVAHGDSQLIKDSALGLDLVGEDDLGDHTRVVKEGEATTHDESWNTVIGTDKTVRNHYAERTISLEDTDQGKVFDLVVRAYDDGVALRYSVPDQDGLAGKELRIVDENTEFRVAGDPRAWWTQRNFDYDENVWKETKYSEMGASNAPVTLQWGESDFMSIHEADLVDYSAMTLAPTGDGALRAELVPAIGRDAAVVTTTGRSTPWRAMTISERAGGLIESHLLENLNPPLDTTVFGSEEQARTWVKPTTYVGIWWMLQKDQASWNEGPRLGATTARAKEYIDFAAAHGIGGLLAEGWNKGWDSPEWKAQNYSTPADGFDLEEVLAYAKEKGVEFIGHNETGGNPWNYEKQIDDGLFSTYKDWGIHYLKTGYVGDTPNIPSKEEALSPDFDPAHYTGAHHRYDQTMVNHFRKVLVEAAKNQINVNCHECVHSTGEARTYPNAIAREAVRGGEYDAFTTEGNSPEHTLIIPFTRMLTGPMDYTPGIMNITWDPAGRGTRVHTTAAKQLAEAVNYFSGVQMAADTPENYSVNRGIEFYKGLPASWDETRVVSADIGQELVTARRSGDSWWVGAMNGANPRDVRIPLSFLGEGQWVAESFSDDATTDYDTNPIPISVDTYRVSASDTLTSRLGVSGGQAIRIRKATPADADLPAYKAPSLTVTAIQAPATAQEGDLVSVVVRVRNDGSIPAREDLTLSATGTQDQSRTLSANASGTGSARFQLRLGDPGTVTVSAGGATATIEVLRTLAAPAPLRIVDAGAGRTTVEWESVEGATGYELYRRTEEGHYGEAPRARLGADRTSFRDARQSGASYRWVVRAVFDGVLSAPSNEVGGPGEVVASMSDPAGDDDGPGSYTYPTNGVFVPGAYDLTKIEVLDAGISWTLRTTIAGEVTNPWGGSGISVQHIEYYIGDGTGQRGPARAGTNMDTASTWSRVVVADGPFNPGVFDTGNHKVADVGLTSRPQDHTISVSVPKSALPGFDPKTSRIGVAMFSSAEGGEGINNIRPVYDWNDPSNPSWLPEWRPGGGLGHQDESKPSKDSDTRDANAFDIIVGEGQTQSDVLDWNKQTPAVLPMVALTPQG